MDTSEKHFEANIEASLLRDPSNSRPQDVPALADNPDFAEDSLGWRFSRYYRARKLSGGNGVGKDSRP